MASDKVTIDCAYLWGGMKDKCKRGSGMHSCKKKVTFERVTYERHLAKGNLGKAIYIECGVHRCKCGNTHRGYKGTYGVEHI